MCIKNINQLCNNGLVYGTSIEVAASYITHIFDNFKK